MYNQETTFNILLNIKDVNTLYNICMINKQTYDICSNNYFWSTYYTFHKLPLSVTKINDLVDKFQKLEKILNCINKTHQILNSLSENSNCDCYFYVNQYKMSYQEWITFKNILLPKNNIHNKIINEVETSYESLYIIFYQQVGNWRLEIDLMDIYEITKQEAKIYIYNYLYYNIHNFYQKNDS